MADTVIEKPTTNDEEQDNIRLLEDAGKKHNDKKEKEDEPEKKIDEDEEIKDEELIGEEEEPKITTDEDKLLDEVQNYRGIDFKKLKEKYPDFAKTDQFRALRDSFYRESKFSELFPTVEDAQEALENHETFIKLNSEIIDKGSISGLLVAIKEANPDSLRKVSEEFLDAVNKIDNSLYVKAIEPVVRRLAKQIYADGMKHKSRNPESTEAQALIATAKNLGMWAFDDTDFVERPEEQPKRNTELEEKEK